MAYLSTIASLAVLACARLLGWRVKRNGKRTQWIVCGAGLLLLGLWFAASIGALPLGRWVLVAAEFERCIPSAAGIFVFAALLGMAPKCVIRPGVWVALGFVILHGLFLAAGPILIERHTFGLTTDPMTPI